MSEEKQELPKQPNRTQALIADWAPLATLSAALLVEYVGNVKGAGLVGVAASSVISLETVRRKWYRKNVWTWEASWIMLALSANELGRRLLS